MLQYTRFVYLLWVYDVVPEWRPIFGGNDAACRVDYDRNILLFGTFSRRISPWIPSNTLQPLISSLTRAYTVGVAYMQLQ